MSRIWLNEYPTGVPADVDSNEFSSLRDLIEQSCSRFAELPAYSNLGAQLKFRDIEYQSRCFGAWLCEVAGLERGDRVAIMLPNILQYPVSAFGVLRAGLVIVNVNPEYTPRELEYQLVDSGAKAIVVLENFAHTLEKVIARTSISTVVTTRVGDLFPLMKKAVTNWVVHKVKKLVPPWNLPTTVQFPLTLAAGSSCSLPAKELTHDDIAFLQYTGGTTGVSKGAILTHGNMVANVQQASAWLSPVTHEGTEVLVTALPLYHIFALTANCLTYMKLGGENVLITNPRDFDGFVRTLRKIRFTGFTGVNTLYNALLNTPGFARLDFTHLRVCLGGGMAVQQVVAEHWMKVTGHPLIEAYGLTETSPAACINPMTNREYNGSIGVPISSTWVTICDDSGALLPTGEIGEICIRGPQVMKGYWNRPEETAAVMHEGGWLRTGDVGRMDERGYVYIEDRKKDMILVSGFNVYPNEIEGVAVSMNGIREAAAIGVPHPKSGEAVKLFVARNDSSLTKDQVVSYCRERLSAYKVPKFVEFREELPKSNVGKILRRALRDS